MNALFIISEYGITKEFQFNYVNQDYTLFKETIKNLGYTTKFIISTEKCIDISDINLSKCIETAKISYSLPAITSKSANIYFPAETIQKVPINTHYVYYIFRACASCVQCKKHAATFKNSQLCVYCAKSYKSYFCGKEEVLY